ncbi:MAG: M48 family metallopeptidase [Anaerolineae bacterium]|nr:M48 family metallopeptidase [Anaerolineae bacterium]
MSLRNEQLQAFVADALEQIGGRVVPENAPEITSTDELRALVKTWAQRIGVQPTRVSVREMFRKWGSCSRKGSVSLNTALCRVPRELAEYVICHELVHLIEFNHGKGFKALMNEHMPDWRVHEQALSEWMAGGTLD